MALIAGIDSADAEAVDEAVGSVDAEELGDVVGVAAAELAWVDEAVEAAAAVGCVIDEVVEVTSASFGGSGGDVGESLEVRKRLRSGSNRALSSIWMS